MFVAIAVLLLLYLLSSHLILPIITYLRDPKNLRRYPNFHALAGLSDLPFLHASHTGFRSRTLHELHKTHPVLRIGPNALSYGHPDAIKDIYGHGTACVKDRFYSETSGSHAHLADVVDKQDHARKRKVLSSAYALKNLEDWEFKVADMTRRLLRAFDGMCTDPLPVNAEVPEKDDLTVDYRAWTNHFTVAAIANIGLSEDLGFLEQGGDRVLSESMDGKVKQVSFRECREASGAVTYRLVWAYDWFPTLKRLSKVFSKYRRLWKLDADWNGIVYNRATTRLKLYLAGEKLEDFLAMMEDKKGVPHNLEMGEIVAEISIMMNAGSDTTAISLRNVLFFLLKNPRCMGRLREELDEVLDEDEVVAPYSKVKHLPYLRACIDESLRMLPPRGPRSWVISFAGHTSVSMSAYVVHHDESVFTDHNSYQPERWLGKDGKSLQSYFIPFSTGARGCIGRNISDLEQTVLLASLVHRYDFALPSPDWDPPIPETTNLSPGPMPLKIWRRVRVD
ncbi:cytochrome P450 [Aspergillus aurantiobrunneus]